MFDLGINEGQLLKSKEELTKSGLYGFFNEWVQVRNDFSYCDYHGRDRVEESRQKEESKIPSDVTDYFKGLTRGYQPVVNNPLNHKPINTKQGGVGGKLYGGKWTLGQVGDLVVKAFNTHLGTSFKASGGILPNLDYWLTVYSPQEIEQAIKNIKLDPFWKDKMTPTVLFRRKNPQGEPVDNIGLLINLKEKNGKHYE